MALWFVRGLQRGVVTTAYPAAAEISAAALPTPPAFTPRDLTAALADRLAAACPSGALAREEATLMLDLGRCTACGRCIELGGSAVRSSGAFELTATRREHLLVRIPIEGEQA